MKLRQAILAAGSVLALGFSATPASAATLVVGGGWSPFSFGAVGSSWSDTFDFVLASAAELQVTDAFLSGDQFRVFINAIDQGLTSAPGSTGDSTSDYAAAFSDSRWSSGSYVLGPGSYSVSGLTAASPFGGGGAAIQLVSSAVPEPASWAMLLVGFGLIGGAIRRRKSQQPKVGFAF